MTIIEEPATSRAGVVGLFVSGASTDESIFDGSMNPDGLLDKWAALYQEFSRSGILLTTERKDGVDPAFELHLNARIESAEYPAYAVLSECRFIHSANSNPEALEHYRQCFTWNDDLCEEGLATKIQLGNRIAPRPPDGYKQRPLLCALIAANKALPAWNRQHDLYRHRVAVIRWFETNAPEDFALYGKGWQFTAKLPGLTGRVIHRLEQALPLKRRPFPSWRGIVQRKHDVLVTARFSICYENVSGLRGYITEKLFDSFNAGCVPIYWGASNIEQYIPKECFIDRREFSNHEDLYAFLKKMPEQQYRRYQEAIHAFLGSRQAYPFSAEWFAKTIVSSIMADLVEDGIAL